jgi:hypothetical protein
MNLNMPIDRLDQDLVNTPMIEIKLRIDEVVVYQKSYASTDSIRQCLPDIEDLITKYEESL